ncbi:MAG: hypothetical protein HYY00_05575 [Chloroflexi bacterium]|nr:hypothetical protein [Chloroflexota bacterium]
MGCKVEGAQFSAEYGFTLGGEQRGEYSVKREFGKAELKSPPGGAAEFELRDGKVTKWEGDSPEVPSQRSLFELELPVPDATNLAFPTLYHLFWFRLPRSSKGTRIHATPMVQPFRLLHRHLIRMRFYHMFPNVVREPQKLVAAYPLDEHGENLASALRGMEKGNPYLADLKEALGNVVPGVSDVQVTPTGGFLVVKLKHVRATGDGKGAWFDLSQESDGTLRLLGLLVS